MTLCIRTQDHRAAYAHGLGMPWSNAVAPAARFSSNATTKKRKPGSREVS